MAGPISRSEPRSEAHGRPTVGTPAFSLCEADAAKIVSEACRPPRDVGIPVTHWSAHLLGEHLRSNGWTVSDSLVGRILRAAPLQPHLQRMWLTSHDEEFREKRDDVLRLYYEAPPEQHIICLDEKTGMQALERRYPDLPMRPGQPVRREFEYIRHGTLCLMGAFDVRRVKLFGFVSDDKNADTFIDLLRLVDRCYPIGRGHLIADNLSMHDTPDVIEWLDEHPRWTLHFTPKHASWLNQIECVFSTLTRRVLTRGSFTSPEQLRDALYAYMLWFNHSGHAQFRWSYRPKSWNQLYGQTSDVVH